MPTLILWPLVFMLTPLQSLLFAAGLRPTPAQATAASWVSYVVFDGYQISGNNLRIPTVFLFNFCLFEFFLGLSQILKDGMQHVGKLICSNLGARMDSEPKCWRILGL